ncbi:MAG TPA: hypothetical protein VKK79_13815, partial [Candidatus Lokiarchaeia archaeon]|nr:hypothetical protein [Candidatus Lokiarchaeia archaeon]
MASGADHLDMWPYITQFKAPRFQLFSQVQRVPDFHIPFRVEMENVVREFEQFILNQSQLPLETLYWYCILKKYSFADFPETVRQKVLDIVNECEVESSEEIGFYQKKDNATPVPTIWGTFFALSIYSILDQLIPYLQMNPELKRRERLINFVMNRNQRGLFVHCLDRRCQKEKDRNFLFQTQLYALGTLDLAGHDLLSLDPKLIDVIFHKIERKQKRFALKLLILRYLGKQGDVSESDITGFFSLQKKDGGFNFVAGSVRGEIPDTFWITSALEAYRWLMDYPKGKIYSFLLNHLKKISAANSFRSELEVRDTAMALVLLSYVWGSLIEEVEMVVFDKFSLSQTVDLDKFAEEVGLEGVEKEVIAYINAKYQFALEISDNQVNFRNTLRTMDRVHALFSKMIYERVKARPTVDLTELMASYNRDRPRKERMSIDILQEIIDTLINENYIIGKIVKKRKGVISHNILEVSRVIKRVITINVPLDNDKIEREKAQIREFEQDIENMTFEIQKSSRNIYSEVESLIIVDEVRVARQRLNSLIKNSLFDASFFNKNVEKFQSEFTYLNAKNLLRDKVLRWEQVFGDLRRNFRTIQDLLLKRIDEREKVIEEREKVEELERQIQAKIASFMERIGDFKEKAYDALKGAVEPAEITNLGEKVQVIQTQLQKVDEKIAEFSQSINPQEEDMKEARKSAVDYWIAKREEIDGKMKDLLRVFKKWRAYHKRILAKKKEIVDNVLNFKESIKSAFGESGPDQAAETLDQELNGILEFLSTESQQMKQDLDADGEIFKTLPGLRLQIEREWTETQQFVEVNLNKIRAEVLVQIETARENQLQEEFNVLVDREIRYLQDLLKQTRSWLQSKLEGEQNLAIDQYRQVIQEAEREWTEKKQHIKDLQESNKTLYFNFEKNCKISIYKFDTFAKYFDQEFQQLKDQFFTDLVKQEAVQTADASEENVVDIAELAKKLEVNKKELRARMKSMLSDSILEGELLETCQIFVKTEIWVKVEKIRKFVHQKIALLQDIKNQIVRLYKTSVENLTLTKTK